MKERYVKAERKKRTNAEWVADLSGEHGTIIQKETLDELARYLFVVAYNDLCARRERLSRLSQFGSDELADLAQDFTQAFMEKMVADQYALLEKFHAKGYFTTWAAQVTLNLVRSEFRKVCWSRELSLNDGLGVQQKQARPELVVLNQQLHELLQSALDQLPSQMRTAFIRLVVDGERASVIAAEMGVTTNTIYMRVHHAKKKMQELLADTGWDQQAVNNLHNC